MEYTSQKTHHDPPSPCSPSKIALSKESSKKFPGKKKKYLRENLCSPPSTPIPSSPRFSLRVDKMSDIEHQYLVAKIIAAREAPINYFYGWTLCPPPSPCSPNNSTSVSMNVDEITEIQPDPMPAENIAESNESSTRSSCCPSCCCISKSWCSSRIIKGWIFLTLFAAFGFLCIGVFYINDAQLYSCALLVVFFFSAILFCFYLQKKKPVQQPNTVPADQVLSQTNEDRLEERNSNVI